jgi:uncharacterized protein YuzE
LWLDYQDDVDTLYISLKEKTHPTHSKSDVDDLVVFDYEGEELVGIEIMDITGQLKYANPSLRAPANLTPLDTMQPLPHLKFPKKPWEAMAQVEQDYFRNMSENDLVTRWDSREGQAIKKRIIAINLKYERATNTESLSGLLRQTLVTAPLKSISEE